MKVTNFLLYALNPFKKYLAFIVLILIMYSVDLSLRPYLVKQIIDNLKFIGGETNSINFVWTLSIILIFMQFFSNLLLRLENFFELTYEGKLKSRIITTLLNRLEKHSQKYYQENSAGEISSRIVEVTNSLPIVINIVLYHLIGNLFTIMIALYALFNVHKLFAVGIFLWITVFIIYSLYALRSINSSSLKSAQKNSELFGYVSDFISNIITVKLFKSPLERSYKEKLQRRMEDALKTKRLYVLRFNLTNGIIFSLYYGLSILLLIYFFKNNQITMGDFAMVIAINTSVMEQLWYLASLISQLTEKWANIRDVLNTVYSKSEEFEQDNKKNLELLKGDISFYNVKFSSNEKEILKNITLSISAGEKIGIVGESGSGKSSFINLLIGLAAPDSGTIKIDGQDISEYITDSIWENISVIPQNSGLFNRDLLDNLKYSNETINIDELKLYVNRAKLDFLWDDILNQTINPNTLSAGQIQRVLIARSLTKKKKILIYDETTSNLDAVTASSIINYILETDNTFVLVSHSLSQLVKMDRIYVFKNGEIIDKGKHEDLIKRDGDYKKIWEIQSTKSIVL